jgi:predicted flap endonuclease-1-like 5' DNA nuclease
MGRPVLPSRPHGVNSAFTIFADFRLHRIACRPKDPAMTLLERVIRNHRCRSTHHFIAFDALSLIGGDDGEAWKSLFLVHHEHLLKGAKAPDAEFKDFKNHVLHVSEGEWGGARAKAMEWYARGVELLTKKRWSEAAYALGVLSHYYADPIQPFHTGQTEAEGVIHRAVEWSIAKSRAETDARIAATGYPEIDVPDSLGFVSDMVRAGAERSHQYYDVFIDHYDLDAGVANPPAGLDETMQAAIADLVAYATAGFAAILSRAVEEAAVAPPKVNLTLQGYFETLDIPLRWITAKLEDASDRRTVEKMYAEFQKTGKVIKTLPADDKKIRALHAKEVRRIPLKQLDAEEIPPIGTLNENRLASAPAELVLTDDAAVKVDDVPPTELAELVRRDSVSVPTRGLLGTRKRIAELHVEPIEEDVAGDAPLFLEVPVEPDMPAAPVAAAEPEAAEQAPSAPRRMASITREDDVVEAPSIGRKTAKALARAGITTIGDLLDCDPDMVELELNIRYITSEALRTWQAQTRLMMDVPGLRVHDAQLLVGAGITSREDLANASARTIFELTMEFLSTPEGERVLRDDQVLHEGEVEEWIEMAQDAA